MQSVSSSASGIFWYEMGIGQIFLVPEIYIENICDSANNGLELGFLGQVGNKTRCFSHSRCRKTEIAMRHLMLVWHPE